MIAPPSIMCGGSVTRLWPLARTDFYCFVDKPDDCIDEKGHFKLKRLQVKSKANLSQQEHHHGLDHWIVDTDTILLEIIEDQSGSLLGEGDIVGLEDTYGNT